MAVAPSTQHHHRSTTKTTNKPFKTRHATKSALKNAAKGKVEILERGTRKTPHQQVMSKLDRRNQAKQRRLTLHSEREEKGSVFAGRDGAPRIVAVVPLCADVVSEEVVRALNASVDIEEDGIGGDGVGVRRVEIPRFKQKVQYLTPSRDLFPCLDACQVADFVLFVLSATEEVDEAGEHLLRCIESQGVPSVLTGVYGLEKLDSAKRKTDTVKSLKSFITHFFATQEKVHDLSNRQECSNVMRSLCTTMPKGVNWREDRSWMLIEESKIEGSQAIITGTVRGRGLKADRLVHISEWGDFEVEKVVAAPYERGHRSNKTTDMAVDEGNAEQVLEQRTGDGDELVELAPEETTMADVDYMSMAPSERKGVLLDDHHYFEEDEAAAPRKPKRLPRGTSKYQAAWYLGDVSDSGSDLESVDGEDSEDEFAVDEGPAEGNFDAAVPDPTEYGAPSEYPQSEMFLDPAPEDEADQLESYRAARRDEAKDDLEFPDEIELLPNVSARERLAKYRGLKSFRTSNWDIEEDRLYEPEDWNRLLEVSDYKSAKNRMLKEALVGGVKAGTRVQVHVRLPDGVDADTYKTRPTAMFSLLRHEHKRTVVNVSLTLSADHPAPIRSKTPIVLQCGPRRLLIKPLFSQSGTTPNNVHKFDRYLHPGRTAVASFLGPVTWGSIPCLFFMPAANGARDDAIESLTQTLQKTSSSGLSCIGTGTSLAPSASRVIAKRVILTGHPFKIHKKLVTVRYMFFNSEDVLYFKALQLWTRRGRAGYIREPLGTHGYFKATFDGKINPLDAVAVSLFKRVWPRLSKLWRVGDSVEAGESKGDEMQA